MDLVKLKYFYTTATCLHVTRASEKLQIAQPALSKSIRLLEDELGVKLFLRRGRSIYLTEHGEYLKNKLEKIFPIFDNLSAEVKNLAEIEGRVIRVNVLAASTIITDMVIGFKRIRPDAIFKLIQNEDKIADITVTTDHFDETISSNDIVFKEEILLAVPKTSKYAKMESISLADVKDEDFINLVGSKKLRSICDKFCLKAGFMPRSVFESDSLLAVKNLIAASVGISFWPEFTWGKIESHDVKLVPIISPECYRQIVVKYHKSENHSSITREFYDYVAEQFKQIKTR